MHALTRLTGLVRVIHLYGGSPYLQSNSRNGRDYRSIHYIQARKLYLLMALRPRDRITFLLVVLTIILTFENTNNIFATQFTSNESNASGRILVVNPCKIYSHYEVRICIPRTWFMSKEVYGNLTQPNYSALNNSLFIELRPCFEAAIDFLGFDPTQCRERPISTKVNPLIAPLTTEAFATILNYTIREIANDSTISEADYLTHYMQKTIKDISADNQSVIMQVSPVLLDGMRGVKISYESTVLYSQLPRFKPAR